MDATNPNLVSAPLPRSRFIALARRLLGPIWSLAGFTAALTMPRQNSRAARQVTVFPVELDGVTYLISQYGVSGWVHDLRAAGRAELRRKGRTASFTAVEVEGDERDRVIAAFHAKTPKPFRRDFEQRPNAGDHPTFRVEPIG